MDHKQLAHLALRVVLGVNLATHGIARVGHVAAFAGDLTHAFAATPLPPALVRAFAVVIPPAELAVGLAILAGLLLREALFAGALLIAALTFGTVLRQQWDVAGTQLVYALAYFVLLFTLEHATLQLWRGPSAAARRA